MINELIETNKQKVQREEEKKREGAYVKGHGGSRKVQLQFNCIIKIT